MALCYQETVVWSVSIIQPMASAASQVSWQKQDIRLSVEEKVNHHVIRWLDMVIACSPNFNTLTVKYLIWAHNIFISVTSIQTKADSWLHTSCSSSSLSCISSGNPIFHHAWEFLIGVKENTTKELKQCANYRT